MGNLSTRYWFKVCRVIAFLLIFAIIIMVLIWHPFSIKSNQKYENQIDSINKVAVKLQLKVKLLTLQRDSALAAADSSSKHERVRIDIKYKWIRDSVKYLPLDEKILYLKKRIYNE